MYGVGVCKAFRFSIYFRRDQIKSPIHLEQSLLQCYETPSRTKFSVSVHLQVKALAAAAFYYLSTARQFA